MNQRRKKRGESDAAQLRRSRTNGNNEPLSDVDDDGTTSPPSLPGHRASGGMGGGPTAAGPQPGTAKTVSLSAQRRPPGPQCPWSWLRSNGTSEQSPDPPQGPANPPVHGRQRPPPGREGAFGSVHRSLKHGRDRLRRQGQCPAAAGPELENRVQALTGPAPRYEFHPGLALEYAGPQDLAYVDKGFPVVQLQGLAYVSGTYGYPGFARAAGIVDQSDGVGANSCRVSPGHIPLDSSYRR